MLQRNGKNNLKKLWRRSNKKNETVRKTKKRKEKDEDDRTSDGRF